MADENFKKSLKIKSNHPVKREDDPHHQHKKIHRDHSDHLQKSPPAQKTANPKPPQPSSSSKPKPENIIKKTKESGIASSSKKPTDDVKPNKSHQQAKPLVESSSKVKQEISSTPTKKSSSNTTKEREKKVYSLPGQKHDPPEERDPLRIFYETLYEQIPTSEMATIWMMEHGLLPVEVAKKAYERKQKKQHQQRTGTPIKSSLPEKKYSSTSEKKRSFNGDSHENMKSMKKSLSYDDDDDFIKPKKKFC